MGHVNRAEHDRRYREKHKDEIRLRQRLWHQKHKDDPVYKAGNVARSTKYNEKKRHGQPRKNLLATECAICKTGEKMLVIHHINGEGWGKKVPDNTPGNHITLCKPCHMKIHHAAQILEFDTPTVKKLLAGLGQTI